MNKISEKQMQIALIEWARLHPICRDYLISYPIGGYISQTSSNGRSYSSKGSVMKRMGAMAGVSDLYLPYPSKGFHGLWLELKVGSNPLTVSQKHWFKIQREVGYKCEEVRDDWLKAKDIIEEYLG